MFITLLTCMIVDSWHMLEKRSAFFARDSGMPIIYCVILFPVFWIALTIAGIHTLIKFALADPEDLYFACTERIGRIVWYKKHNKKIVEDIIK